MDKKCAVNGCGTHKHLSKGYCAKHYMRLRRNGTIETSRLPQGSITKCLAPDCNRTDIESLGYCSLHYQRVHRTGTVDLIKKPQICTIPDCGGETVGRGLCQLHYMRWWEGKSIGDAKRRRRRQGEGTDNRGYRSFKKNGQNKAEHRIVMEQILGRTLTKEEVVHHKNGNRADNRPENLELMNNSTHMSLHRKLRLTSCKA